MPATLRTGFLRFMPRVKRGQKHHTMARMAMGRSSDSSYSLVQEIWYRPMACEARKQRIRAKTLGTAGWRSTHSVAMLGEERGRPAAARGETRELVWRIWTEPPAQDLATRKAISLLHCNSQRSNRLRSGQPLSSLTCYDLPRHRRICRSGTPRRLISAAVACYTVLCEQYGTVK